MAIQPPTFVGFPLGVTSGTYQHTFDLSDAATWSATFLSNQGSLSQAEAVLAAGLASGSAYLNIHTTTFPGGEIRGFVVPEPSTALLVGMGLSGIPLATRGRPRGGVA